MDLVARIPREASHDGRSPAAIPQPWAYLAQAAAGDPERSQWALRLSGAPRVDQAALAAAARRVPEFTATWPWGTDALAATYSDNSSTLGQWRQIALGRREDVAGRVAHVDTTTLANAIGLIDGSLEATPATVLDLAGLLNTLCVYQRVCYLENRNVTADRLDALFGSGLFSELPVVSTQQQDSPYHALGDVREVLRSVYKTRTVPWLNDVRTGVAGTAAQQRAWVSSWETLLGRPCDAQWLLLDPDEAHDPRYPDIGFDSPTAELLDGLVSIEEHALAAADLSVLRDTGPKPRAAVRNLFAQKSNARALFNAQVAGILGVRYAAGLARMPILGLVERDTRAALRTLLRYPPAADALQQVYGAPARLVAAGQSDPLVLPFFAAEVFQRAAAPADIPELLNTIRNKALPLRERLNDLNRAVQAGDEGAIREIHGALGPIGTETYWGKLGFGLRLSLAAADFAMAWMEPAYFAMNVVVALLGPLLDPDMRRTILGQSRIHYGLVGDMRPLIDSADAVVTLWKPREREPWLARLAKLASLGAPHPA